MHWMLNSSLTFVRFPAEVAEETGWRAMLQYQRLKATFEQWATVEDKPIPSLPPSRSCISSARVPSILGLRNGPLLLPRESSRTAALTVRSLTQWAGGVTDRHGAIRRRKSEFDSRSTLERAF